MGFTTIRVHIISRNVGRLSGIAMNPVIVKTTIGVPSVLDIVVALSK